MANMSHCRFYNTNLDLQDCIDYAEQLINTSGKDQDGENLSTMEKDAMLEMIGKAQYFSEIGETLADILYNE